MRFAPFKADSRKNAAYSAMPGSTPASAGTDIEAAGDSTRMLLMGEDPADEGENMEGVLTNADKIRRIETQIGDNIELQAYLPKPGIPVPPRKSFRLALMFRWSVAIAAIHCAIYYALFSMTTQTIWRMSRDITKLQLDMTNCDLTFAREAFEEGTNRPSIIVQHWNFLGHSSVFEKGETVTVKVSMHVLNPMFRCQVVVYNPKGVELQHVHGHIEGSSLSHVLVHSPPTESMHLHMPDSSFTASKLPKLLNISAYQGRVRLEVPADASDSIVNVNSVHASIFVASAAPLDVTTKGSAKDYATFTAKSVQSSGETVMLKPGASSGHSGNPVKITFKSQAEAPSYYVLTNDLDGEVQTKKGDALERLGVHANLTEESATDLEHLHTWMASRSGIARPWLVKIRMWNAGMPCGSFYIVSSEAYLVFKLELLALISATLLLPDLKEQTVEILNLQSAWPPKNAAAARGGCVMEGGHLEREDGRLKEAFHALQKYLVDHTGTVAWVPDGEFVTSIVFQRRGRGWRTHYHQALSGQSLLFLWALALNVLASTVTASVALYLLGTHGRQWIMDRYRQGTVGVAASQRITRGSSPQAWRVNATLVDYPHGVLLRWTKLSGEQRPTYLWIKAEAVEDPMRGLPYDEVIIERVKNERVPSMRENNGISEFFFPIEQSCPTGVVYDHSQRKADLKHMYTYRFKLETFDHSDEPMVESEWSNEVFIAPRSSIFDLPLILVKQLCPVPTASLGYFLDHYAERHINGKTPQQILVLSDLSLTFHRNFNKFGDCDESFYITVFAGDSRDACQKETYAGRVRTFDRTAPFKPPRAAIEESPIETGDEERRIQLKPFGGGQFLRLGRHNEDVTQVTFRLHFATSGDDVGEAKYDWADLTWNFQESEDREEGEDPQMVKIDIVPEKKEIFDEDYLVYLRGRVSFQNSIDKKCTEIDRNQRFFTEDAPGKVFYKGMERFVEWDADSALIKDECFDLFIEYPDLPQNDTEKTKSEDSNPRLLARRVQKASVGTTMMIDFPTKLSGANFVSAQLYAQDAAGKKVRSHRFVICKTWLLTEMELMYASFCKMNGVAMQQLTEDARREFGIGTRSIKLKVVPRIRKPMPFEHQILYENACSFTIADNNITVKHLDDFPQGGESGDYDEQRSAQGSDKHSASRPASSKDSKKLSSESREKTFVVTSQRVEIVEAIWPRTLYFSIFQWNPALLLTYDFYPVDNIINALSDLCQLTRISALWDLVQYVLGAHLADRVLHFLLAPLLYLLPFFAESVLFLVQFVFFMVLPLIPLIMAATLEYLKYAMNESFRVVSDQGQLQECLPDAFFRRRVSGYGVDSWLKSMADESQYAVLGSCFLYVALLFFMFETHFLRDFWPPAVQASVRGFFNDAGDVLVGACVWVVLFSICMCGLWFVMAVVIYPEQMMVVLSVVGGMLFVGWSMLTRYRATKDQINMFLKDEVPEILDLICENFLRQHEREDLGGAFQKRSLLSSKLEQMSYRETRAYIATRFKNHEVKALIDKAGNDSKALFQKIFDRALLKRESWASLAGNASGRRGSSAGDEAKTTEQILNESGLTQEDTSGMDHFMMRIRIADRETELRDKSVHQYSEDLRQRLMQAFIRGLENTALEEDVQSILSEPKKLSKAIHHAQKAKLELFDETKYEGEGSLMQLFISDVNQKELKKYEVLIAAFMDKRLDSTQIAETTATYIWQEVPNEIMKELRLALDEHVVGSAMQKVLEKLRRWKSERHEKGGEASLRAGLTLKSCPTGMSPEEDGLLKMLMDIEVLDPRSSLDYRQGMWRHLEREVREWRDEEEQELTVNAGDLESFVGDLLSGKVWWGALVFLLSKLGFPYQAEDHKDNLAGSIPLQCIRVEFESSQMVKRCGGFLPTERIPDFLCVLTRADTADGGCGRIWKAQMVRLMAKLGICGHMRIASAGAEAKSAAQSPGTALTFIRRKKKAAISDSMKQEEGLEEAAVYEWPRWLEVAWRSKAPKWEPLNGKDLGENTKPFMPKSELYSFLQEIPFMPGPDQEGYREPRGNRVKVDEEYANWLKDRDEQGIPVGIWTKRGKAQSELRGIWQECFLFILQQMNNGVSDQVKGIELFEHCREEQRKRGGFEDEHREGLLNVHFLVQWLHANLVNNTTEASLEVFQAVLERCELSLPKIVVTSLWQCATPSERFNGNWALRMVRDLEDRLVMYLVKGIPMESCQALIFDVLPTHSLQTITPQELRTLFKQVDTKLGMNGFLEPREIKALIMLISQAGMCLADLMKFLKDLGCDFPEQDVKEAFLLLDTSGDDLMDLPEFLGLMDFIILRLIPGEILRVMGLQPQQVLLRLAFAVLALVAAFFFILISLGAFHVDVSMSKAGEGAANGASMVRVVITLLAIVALKRETSEEDEERFFKLARDRLYAMLGVTHSQIDARRRAMGLLSNRALPTVKKAGGVSLKMMKGGDDEEEEDEGGGDD